MASKSNRRDLGRTGYHVQTLGGFTGGWQLKMDILTRSGARFEIYTSGMGRLDFSGAPERLSLTSKGCKVDNNIQLRNNTRSHFPRADLQEHAIAHTRSRNWCFTESLA